MRDALYIFGDITLVTADTDVKSADVLDMETLTGSRFSRHAAGVSGPDLYIVFKAADDFSASSPEDGMIPFLEEGSAESGGDITSPKKILIGPQITAPEKGNVFAMPIPANVDRYIRAGCTPKSDATFDGAVVEAWIEFGPNVPEQGPDA